MMQGYAPIHDTVPIAVRIAVAIDAIICTIHLKVSFFVIMVRFFTIDLRSSLLTLGIAQTSLALLSLNRSFHYSLFTIHFKSVSFAWNGRAASVSAATALGVVALIVGTR